MNNEEVATRWIEMILSEKIHGELLSSLQDGTILCHLINQLYRSVGMKHVHVPIEIQTSTNIMFSGSCKRQNIRTFIEACRFFGVSDEAIFRPNDLLKGSNSQRVYSCILALQAVALRMAKQRTPEERASLGSFASYIEADTSIKQRMMPMEYTSQLDTTNMTMFTDIATSTSSWKVLLEVYEAQQSELYQLLPTHHEGCRMEDDSGTQQLATALWTTEERVKLLLRDEAACRHLTPSMHGKLWLLLSGANVDVSLRKGYYSRLLAQEPTNTDSIRQIDADVPRTVPPEDTSWTNDMNNKLKNVLTAYSNHNPTLGYCQGLNYVVARLLQNVEEEEEAFWLLDRMISMLPDDYYTTMLGVAIDQHVFAELVALQTPDLIQHIESLGGFGAELSLACTEWFCTLFGSPFRSDVTVRVWDILFSQGSEELFRMALAIIEVEYPNIMSCHSYGDVLVCLNEIGREENLDAKLLVRIARKQTIVTSTRIDDLRAFHRLDLASGIALSKARATNSPPLSNESTTTKKRKHPLSNRKITARTMSRHLSLESMDAKVEDSAEAKYFQEIASPQLLENYWGQADVGPTPWNVAQFKLISSPRDADTVSRPRQFSDTSYRHSLTGKSNSFRETRSKSTAEGLRHRSSTSSTPVTAPEAKPTVTNFFKKIEEWTNKTLKKDKGHNGINLEFMSGINGRPNFFFGQRDASSPIVWDTIPPSSRGSSSMDASDSSRDTPVHKVAGATTPKKLATAVSAPIPIIIHEDVYPSSTSQVELEAPSLYLADSPTPITLGSRMVGSRSTPSLISLEKSSYDSQSDEELPNRPRSTSTTYRPPRYRTTEGKKPISSMPTLDDVTPPDMRRHTSMPARNGRQGHKYQNMENVRLLRERAHVVSYLQRKASDVSSLTSGSPVESDDYRDSLSSDEGTRRAHRATNRTNSFSFLGNLSVDLERSLLLDEKE